MANIRFELIQVLRTTALKIEKSDSYQWGHMGLCNCGFLAQEVTSLTKEEIHRRAMQRHGDWTEQLNDYCPTSGLPMDSLIDELVEFGFTAGELQHLERLSDPIVLQTIPFERRHLKHNAKKDVVLYLNAWATVLEESLLEAINIKELEQAKKIPIL
jgi:hypothetical protein